MKQSADQIRKSESFRIIALVINSTRLIADRVRILREKGFNIDEKSMGSGGALQVRGNKVQISYGHGRYNYATVVCL